MIVNRNIMGHNLIDSDPFKCYLEYGDYTFTCERCKISIIAAGFGYYYSTAISPKNWTDWDELISCNESIIKNIID